MRFSRSSLLFCVMLLITPSWAQQATGSQTTSQPASDPQAIAVVHAAITALGGATAIGLHQGWSFQATLQGPLANGTVNYSMGWDGGPATQIVLPNGATKRGRLTQSLFVPAIIGSVLLDESQDPGFVMRYSGTKVIDSKPVTAISFSAMQMPNETVQTWWFDSATTLPVRVEFQLAAEVGSRRSFQGVVDLSDYRSASGFLHPFRIIMIQAGRPPEFILLQSVSPSATAPPAFFDGSSGDV